MRKGEREKQKEQKMRKWMEKGEKGERECQRPHVGSLTNRSLAVDMESQWSTEHLLPAAAEVVTTAVSK